jgi:hypothetical protein
VDTVKHVPLTAPQRAAYVDKVYEMAETASGWTPTMPRKDVRCGDGGNSMRGGGGSDSDKAAGAGAGAGSAAASQAAFDKMGNMSAAHNDHTCISFVVTRPSSD